MTVTAAFIGGCSLIYWPSDDTFTSDTAPKGDASMGDATTSSDGAATGEGAVAIVGCPASANAIFCDDFEHDSVPGKFDKKHGLATISTAGAHSPARSLSALVSKGVEAASLDSELTLPRKVTLSLWFYAPKPPPRDDGYRFRIAHLLWGAGCDWDLAWTLDLSVKEGLTMAPAVYDQGVNASCGPIMEIERALLSPSQVYVPRWHHLVATMDVSTRTRHVEGLIDDAPVIATDVTSNRDSVPKTASLSVGLPCIQQNSGCLGWDGDDYEVLIDDVSITPN